MSLSYSFRHIVTVTISFLLFIYTSYYRKQISLIVNVRMIAQNQQYVH